MDDEKIAQSVHPELTDKTESEPKVTITREQLFEAVKGISETREYALSHGIDRIINGWSKEVANKIADKLGL